MRVINDFNCTLCCFHPGTVDQCQTSQTCSFLWQVTMQNWCGLLSPIEWYYHAGLFDQTRVCGFLYTLGAFWKWDCGCVGGFWYWAVRSVAFYRAETDARDSPDRKTRGLKSRAVYFFETTTNLRSFFNIKGMVHSLIVPNLCKFLSSVEHKTYIFWRMQVTKQLTVAIDLVFIRSFIRSVNIPTSIFIIIPVVKQNTAMNQSSSCPYFSP